MRPVGYLVALHLARRLVRLVVEDSGHSVGLARRVTPSEFQVEAQRAGLGVALCREHAEEVGGTLSVETRAEGGNRVIICLPAASHDAALPA